MSYMIGDKCVRCGMCERYCPVEAISVLDGDFVIDAQKCIECGTCYDLCPVSAVSLRAAKASSTAGL